MARRIKIQRYRISFGQREKNDMGIWCLWEDVAPYIKEARPTVRPKRAVQQPQPKICPRCGGTKKVPGPFGGPATFTCVDCDTSVIRSGCVRVGRN
jgi:hypothetical protein